MDVSRIGVQNTYTAALKMTAKRDRNNVPENNGPQTNANADVEVDISAEARKKSMELKEYGTNTPLKYDEAFFSQEAREQRKTELGKSLSQTVEIDPFDNEFQILGVSYTFNNGTLEKFISDGLEGKAKNASLVASELAQMIRGTVYNPNATVEERAANRETALRNVESIVQEYFDNPDEAKAFLDGINRFAENDILREKGYTVIDNSDIAPFRSYTLATDGSVSWSEYAKKYGKSDVREIFANPKELEAFVKAISGNSQKWNAEIVKSFEDNEKKVADIISKAKESLNESVVANSLQRLLKAF